jgi:glycosyltransferase involved in cell wall biosynthesis
MNIRYICLNPNIPYAAPRYAPSIHIRETVHGLEALGHHVEPFLYGDHLTGLDLQLRKRKGLGEWKEESHTTSSSSSSIKPLLRDIYELYRNALVDPAMVSELLRGNRVDLIYERLFESKSAVAVSAKQHNVPHIVESNSTTRERRLYWGSPLAALVHRVELDALRRADAVTVISTPLKRYYVQHGIPAEKITVMPNGVNEKRFSRENITRDLRAELTLQDRLVVGFVGNIHPYHGIELLLPLARNMRAKHLELHFLIVGGGPGLGKLVQALEQEGLDGYFTFTGSVPHTEVPNHLAAMDICLLPQSDWLNCPMKLLEYGVMGQAIVAPDLEAIRDLLQHGETALLVKPGDLAEMTSAIEELATNSSLRKKLAQSVQQHILTNHTWTKNAERILGIYRKVSGIDPEVSTGSGGFDEAEHDNDEYHQYNLGGGVWKANFHRTVVAR